MRHHNFNINTLAETLQGTTLTLQGAIEDLYDDMDENDLISEDYEALGQLIFNCTICGWWYEISENVESEDGEMICQDCFEDDIDYP